MCVMSLRYPKYEFFISSASLLPVVLDNTLTKLIQEHKHWFIASEPRQYPGEVACFTSLCRKPLSYFTLLFIYFNITMHWKLFNGNKRDTELLREKYFDP